MADQRRKSGLREFLEAIGDRVVVDGGDLLRPVAEGVRRPFEGVAWGVRRAVIWPLEDRADALGAPARSLSFGAVVLLAAAAGVGALLWAAPGARNAARLEAPAQGPLAAAAQSAENTPGPTLHGSVPVFGPEPTEGASGVGAAEAIRSASPGSGSSSSAAASEKISSIDSSSASSSAAAQSSAVEGPPAGPAAIAVAREFGKAFVLFEVGATDGAVRKGFSEAATPALAHALLRRKPRLPANVTVPKARVVNVVAGPSHGRVYTVSVSLLRVGVTSELRLDMEKQGKDWRVTNVLG
jgi:hypothetical protein